MDKEAVMTIADEFREEGMERGIERGLLILRGLLEDGLISKEIFQQRAAMLQSSTAMV